MSARSIVRASTLSLLTRKKKAEASRAIFQKELAKKRYGAITTEIVEAPAFFYAEDYHQQYLAKNPGGYCGLGGTGVSCPIGVGAAVALGVAVGLSLTGS